MSKHNEGGPAFPMLDRDEQWDDLRAGYRHVYYTSGGMTLRDYFAAKAMQALVHSLNSADRKRYENGFAVGHEATTAYAIADAMLEERGK